MECVTGMQDTWTRNSIVVEVHDGDTATFDRDLGENVWRRGRRYRLAGASCPELTIQSGPEKGQPNPRGVAARDRARELMPVGAQVLTRTIKTPRDARETLGRYVVDVELPDGRSLAEVLIAEGHARPGAFVG